MSAPETTIEKQRKRHIGPLLGMMFVVLFAIGLGFIWLTREAVEEPSAAVAAEGGPDQPSDQPGNATDAGQSVPSIPPPPSANTVGANE